MSESNPLESLQEKAKSQFRQCAIPMVAAIVISVLVAGGGLPLIVLLLAVAGGWAWWRGWRVTIQKPGRKRK